MPRTVVGNRTPLTQIPWTRETATREGTVARLPVDITPANVSDLKLWLAADQGTYSDTSLTTAVTANDSVVGGWEDLSGNGNHAIEATNKPLLKTNVLNGLPVIRGDGSNDLLTVAGLGTNWGATVGTLLIVYRPNGDTVHGLLRFSSASNTYWRYSDSNGYFGPFRSARIEQTPTGQPTTGSHLFVVSSGDAGYRAFRNGQKVIQTTTSWGVSSNLTLFNEGGSGGGFGSVDIAEVLLYNRELTEYEIKGLSTYLKDKWGV